MQVHPVLGSVEPRFGCNVHPGLGVRCTPLSSRPVCSIQYPAQLCLFFLFICMFFFCVGTLISFGRSAHYKSILKSVVNSKLYIVYFYWSLGIIDLVLTGTDDVNVCFITL